MKQHFLVFLLISFPFISSFGELSKDSLNSTYTTTPDTLKTTVTESTITTTIPADTISIEKKSGDIKGYINGELLSYRDYKMLFANEPNALKEIKTYLFLNKTSLVFAQVGGYMFGFILALGLSNIQSVDYTWGLALGASAGIVGIGFLIHSSGNSHQIKAIHIYNSTQENLENKEHTSLKFGFTNSGVGLVYSF